MSAQTSLYLQFSLLQAFYVFVDMAQLLWYLDVLRTVFNAFPASDAVISLSERLYASVVINKILSARLLVVVVLRVCGYLAFVQTFVVMREDARDVDTVRTRHAILACGAWHVVYRCHDFSRLLQHLLLIVVERYDRREGIDIVLEMLHAGHAAKHIKHLRVCACESECP